MLVATIYSKTDKKRKIAGNVDKIEETYEGKKAYIKITTKSKSTTYISKDVVSKIELRYED